MMAVFEKCERLRHIGHLDIMRAMQRAMRRSGLPISYSKGFSPHVLVAFASALSVGVIGNNELMEAQLDADITAEAFLDAMNRALPPDMQLKCARVMDERAPALMATVAAAEYDIAIPDEAETASKLIAAIDAFLAQEDIQAERKTKSGVKTVNIRPMIHALSGEGNTLHASLALTEGASCKVDMLLGALAACAGVEVPRTLVTRLHLLGVNAEGALAPLETL